LYIAVCDLLAGMLSSGDQRGLETKFDGLVLVLVLITIILFSFSCILVSWSRNSTMQNTYYCSQLWLMESSVKVTSLIVNWVVAVRPTIKLTES